MKTNKRKLVLSSKFVSQTAGVNRRTIHSSDNKPKLQDSYRRDRNESHDQIRHHLVIFTLPLELATEVHMKI